MLESNFIIGKFMKTKIAYIELLSRLGLETGISDFFASVANFYPPGNHKRLAQVRIAINEACINAMEHGNKNDESKKIFCEVTEDEEFYEIAISDQGSSFYSPSALPTKEEMENKIQNAGRRSKKNRGMGTYLIHYFSDEVRYEKIEPSGTKIILKFLKGEN